MLSQRDARFVESQAERRHRVLSSLTSLYHSAEAYPRPSSPAELELYIRNRLIGGSHTRSLTAPELAELRPAAKARAWERAQMDEREMPLDGETHESNSSHYSMRMKSRDDDFQEDFARRRSRPKQWKPYTTPDGEKRGRAIIDALHGTIRAKKLGPDLARESYEANHLWRDEVTKQYNQKPRASFI